MQRPTLAPHARYRWDRIREQHQIIFPEGVLVLNSTGAAIVRLCDGRSRDDLVAAIRDKYKDAAEGEVSAFLDRLAEKGLLRNADA